MSLRKMKQEIVEELKAELYNIIEEALVEETFYNVNIGVDAKNEELITTIEKWLVDDGYYFTNDGSDRNTYNINVDARTRSNTINIEKDIKRKFPDVYVETEEIEL